MRGRRDDSVDGSCATPRCAPTPTTPGPTVGLPEGNRLNDVGSLLFGTATAAVREELTSWQARERLGAT